jgi:hypothetical protein
MSNINTLVTKALNSAASFASHVDALRTECQGMDREACTNVLRPAVAKYYGVPVIVKGTGREVLDSSHERAETASTALQRLVKSVIGVTVHRTAEPVKLRIKANERASAAALLAACDGDVKRALAILKAM